MSSSWSDLSLSSASSSSWSAIHPASQADLSTHSPELLALLDIQLSLPVLQYVVDYISHSVDEAFGRSPRFRRSRRFTSFVSTVLSRAEIPLATVLVTLHYVTRARPQLTIAVSKYALERVFLGALVCAAKYTNDSTLKNVHWGMCTGIFGTGDIGRIEREFLEVLDWELGFTEEELLRARQSGVAGRAGDAFDDRLESCIDISPLQAEHSRDWRARSRAVVAAVERRKPLSAHARLTLCLSSP
ncbi:hypothetical protein FB45DRAFT_829573 [Roridomyces roridus]|uniref:Cyclin N-terminal domain-containing protein n=1 Tax=Roridomyces roridus TaxID=1738132 RepID=A0AAD7BYE4_9AGAR|nr:hypothetical protein FB45DRAFT_829573 [Roridomyces roridus]